MASRAPQPTSSPASAASVGDLPREMPNAPSALGMTAALLASVVLAMSFGCRKRVEGSEVKATPEDRKVIGQPVALKPMAAITDQAVKNFKTRRALAWKEVARALKQVKIGRGEGLSGFTPEQTPTLPVWQTWYDSGEFLEIFKRLYTGLGKEGRKAKKAICPSAIKAAHAQHATKALKGWTPEKLEQRLGQLKKLEDVRGVSGKGVTLFSPAVIDSLLYNYAAIMKCPDVVKALRPDAPAPSASNFSHCLPAEFPSGTEKALSVKAEDYAHCPEVDRATPTVPYGASGVSFAMKTAWHVAHRDEVGSFATDAEGIKKALSGGEWLPDKMIPDAELTPSKIYTIRLQPSGREYWLTGLHFVVKSLRHWMWITLFWSDKPNEDFGEDRPADFNAMGPWANYKMCVTTDYVETDPDPAGSVAQYPSLAAAVRATQERASPHSWCSNPYIELGLGNSRGNCIGCHQHAGGNQVESDEVFLDDPREPENAARRAKFPGDGRAQIRANFPSDYLWSLTKSPDFFESKIRGKAYEIDLGDQ